MAEEVCCLAHSVPTSVQLMQFNIFLFVIFWDNSEMITWERGGGGRGDTLMHAAAEAAAGEGTGEGGGRGRLSYLHLWKYM